MENAAQAAVIKLAAVFPSSGDPRAPTGILSNALGLPLAPFGQPLGAHFSNDPLKCKLFFIAELAPEVPRSFLTTAKLEQANKANGSQ